MFLVYGATPDHPQDEMIQRAIDEGIEDDRGELLQVIELQSLVQSANNDSTHGFEDTIITVEGSGFFVSHRTPGRIQWEQQRFGKPKAKLAKTKKNMEGLCAMYYDRTFKILNATVDAEVRAMADKMIADLPEDKREEYLRIVNGKHLSGYMGGKVRSDGKKIAELEPLADNKGKSAEKIQTLADNADIRKREAALQKEREQFEREKATHVSSIAEKIALGGSVTKYTHVGLMAEKVFTLRKIARTEFGVQSEQTAKKDWLVDRILKEQDLKNQLAETKMKAKEQPLEVTG